jgi:tRNA dimethylallyltransferase
MTLPNNYLHPHQLLCIVGPTASGKSSLAVTLAQQWNAEIISVDASQVYCGLDIGTGKVSAKEQQNVVHHLIDCMSPSEHFDAALFVQYSQSIIQDIINRGKRVILCGGTGLYFKTLLHGLCDAPAIKPEIKAYLGQRIEAGEVELLHQELIQVDPLSAEKIKPKDKQRVERALGVYLSSGETLSTSQARHGFKSLHYPAHIIGIDYPRADLNDRIAKRIEQMFIQGFVNEVSQLIADGYATRLQSMSAIGYRLVAGALQGTTTLDQAQERMLYATRQYARRQRRYFDKQLATQWYIPPLNIKQINSAIEQFWL